MSHNFTFIIKNIKYIISYWRFIPAKHPPLCRRTKIILKLPKFTYQLPNIVSQLVNSRPHFTKLPFTNSQDLMNRTVHSTTLPARNAHFYRQFQKPSRCWSCSLDPLHLHLTLFLWIFHAEQTAILTALHHIKTNLPACSSLYQTHSQPCSPLIPCH